MSLVFLAAILAMALVAGGVVSVSWRLLMGPSSADRMIAADMLGLLGICVAALFAILSGHPTYLNIALGVAFFGFLGAVAFAILLERGSVGKDEEGK